MRVEIDGFKFLLKFLVCTYTTRAPEMKIGISEREDVKKEFRIMLRTVLERVREKHRSINPHIRHVFCSC